MEKENGIYCSTCQGWGTLDNGKNCPDCPENDWEKNLLVSVAGEMSPTKFALAVVGAKWVSTVAEA